MIKQLSTTKASAAASGTPLQRGNIITNTNASNTNTNNNNNLSVAVESVVVTLHGMFDLPRSLSRLDPLRERIELVLRPIAKYYRKGRRLTLITLPESIIYFSPSDIVFRNDRFCIDFDKTNNNKKNVCSTSSIINIINNSSSSPGVPSRGASGGGSTSNEITLTYPVRQDLKTFLEVVVGVRIRLTGGYTWLTPALDGDIDVKDAHGACSVADGELHRSKVVHRFVGLTAGRLSLSISIPHVQERLTAAAAAVGEVHAVSSAEAVNRRIAAAAHRLVCDAYRLAILYPDSAPAEKPVSSNFAERLRNGESEFAIYSSLLTSCDPQYYVRRVRRILEMYPPTAATALWLRHATAESLVSERCGAELQLIQELCVELGPEPSSVSPRMRYRAFLHVGNLSDQQVRVTAATLWGPNDETDMLDYEPDVFFAGLEKHYQVGELRPAEYNVAKVQVNSDKRTHFSDVLCFPVNRAEGRYRDQALAGRQIRIPLQLTPCERPLVPADPHSRRTGEIDLLLDKYKGEFTQLIPSIAEAMDAVVRQHEALTGSPAAAVARGSPFASFFVDTPCEPYTMFLGRLSEYTYISPSSLLAAVVYLDRLLLRYPDLTLTRFNISRLFIAATRISSKVVDLRSVNNRNFAHVFQLPPQEMNHIEERLLKLMSFDFFLSPYEFYTYVGMFDLSPTSPWWLRAGETSHFAKSMSAAYAELQQQQQQLAAASSVADNVVVIINNDGEKTSRSKQQQPGSNMSSPTARVGSKRRPSESSGSSVNYTSSSKSKPSSQGGAVVVKVMDASLSSRNANHSSTNNNANNNNNDFSAQPPSSITLMDKSFSQDTQGYSNSQQQNAADSRGSPPCVSMEDVI